jgi:hypothetical protein
LVSRHLRKHVRIILAEAEREARARGCRVTLVAGHRHQKLVIDNGRGARRVKPICSSDAPLRWQIADVRKLVQEIAS